MKLSPILCASVLALAALSASASGKSDTKIIGPGMAPTANSNTSVIGPSMSPTERQARTQTNAAVSKINQDPQKVASVAKLAESNNTNAIRDLLVQNGAPSELVITKASSPPKGGAKRIKVSCTFDSGPPWKLSCSVSW